LTEIVLLGTADYSWAVRIFALLFNRHYGKAPVTWFGDKEPGIELPPNFAWRQVPAFGEGSWPWDHHFGRGLISILETLESEVVGIFLPDHWIAAPVAKDHVVALERFMTDSGRVLRGHLTHGTCLDGHGKVIRRGFGHDFVSIYPTDHHCSFGGGMTFCPSLWNRKALLGLLEPHWDLWACEKVGTEKFARTLWKQGWISAGIKPAPVARCHGLSHAAPRAVNLSGLSERDRREVLPMIPAGWEVL